jgi:succinate dehydrogenase / fumarate reductase membrane anchor subunit
MSQHDNQSGSLRSPLGKVLGLGTAKEGVKHWWSQRVTAVGLALLGVWFIVSLFCLGSFEYGAVTMWIANPCNATLLSIFIATLAYHSQLGVQVVIEDYVHGALKTVSIVASSFFHVVVGTLGVVAVLRIAFGVAA